MTPADDIPRRLPESVEAARLEPMVANDLDQVLEIESVSFATPWLRKHFEYEIRHRGGPVAGAGAVHRIADVLRLDVRVVGYVCAWLVCGELKINNIAVAPRYRTRGVGRWLLLELLDRARAAECTLATLEVRPSNLSALALYRKEGFVEKGRRPDYYQREGEDAIVMELDLVASSEL